MYNLTENEGHWHYSSKPIVSSESRNYKLPGWLSGEYLRGGIILNPINEEQSRFEKSLGEKGIPKSQRPGMRDTFTSAVEGGLNPDAAAEEALKSGGIYGQPAKAARFNAGGELPRDPLGGQYDDCNF